MAAYYNEVDPYAAQWLRNLIDHGHIASGVVDERSIEDVRPSDLAGFDQCHFFAGIGVWSHALRLAGWPDDRPVWTGSCPCQPFSAAGKGAGFADERHLWPAWHHLIRECRPAVVLGEQVASKHANAWIDLVHDDMEALDYAFGAIPFPAAGVGAPHIRDRLYWVAYAEERGRRDTGTISSTQGSIERGVRYIADGLESGSAARGVAYADSAQPRVAGVTGGTQASGLQRWADIDGRRASSALADTANAGHERRRSSKESDGRDTSRDELERLRNAGFWSNAEWIACRDGKARPIEPGTFPLVAGAPSRVGRLRAYGNSLNAEAARVFIEAAISSITPGD